MFIYFDFFFGILYNVFAFLIEYILFGSSAGVNRRKIPRTGERKTWIIKLFTKTGYQANIYAQKALPN